MAPDQLSFSLDPIQLTVNYYIAMLEASIGLDVDKRSATGWQRPKKSMELVPHFCWKEVGRRYRVGAQFMRFFFLQGVLN